MTATRTYLDYNASTPLRAAAGPQMAQKWLIGNKRTTNSANEAE